MVGRDTGLPGVEELRERHPARGQLEVGVLGDDDRRLAAELEGHRGEVLRRCRRDDPADGAVARVEDVVPPLVEQRGRLRDAALDHRDGIGVEVLRQDPRECRRRRRGDLGRLADDGVPRRQSSGQGSEKELHRVVPRRDDKYDAQGLAHDLRPAGTKQGRHLPSLGLHPAAEVAEHVFDLAPRGPEIRRPCLERRPAQVLDESGNQLLLPLLQHPEQCRELLLAPLDRASTAAGVRRAKPGDELLGISVGEP